MSEIHTHTHTHTYTPEEGRKANKLREQKTYQVIGRSFVSKSGGTLRTCCVPEVQKVYSVIPLLLTAMVNVPCL